MKAFRLPIATHIYFLRFKKIWQIN